MANGTYEQFAYDNRSRVTDISTKNSAHGVLRSRAYTFDVASQVTQVVEGGVTTAYGYDLAGQLSSEAKSSGYTGSYTYDANGNRLSRAVNGVVETYSYDAGDKLLSVSGGLDPRTFVYDAAGRTTGIVRGSGTTAFAYDYEGRVTSVTRPGMVTNSMAYNGLDTRVSLADSSGTKVFRRDGVGVTAPVLGDGAANFSPGVSENRAGVKTYFHHGLKNTDAQTNAAQAVVATREYDAFGSVVSSSGPWASQFGNAGRFGYQEDPGSGLKLLGHRYYDSSTGRFLTRDPAKDGRNWYGYCGNSPALGVDPTGLKKYVWISGDRGGGVQIFEPIPVGWVRLIHPTDEHVLEELADADVAVFWGHGYDKGGAFLYNPDYTGGDPARSAFTKEDFEALRRGRRGKKLQTLFMLNCESVKDKDTVQSMLAVAHVVVGYEGSTIHSGPTIHYPLPTAEGNDPGPMPPQVGGFPHPRVGRVLYD